MPRFHTIAWGTVLIFGTASPALAEPPCRAIRFPPGASRTTINGVAPATGALCYTLATGNDQTARLQVTSGRNVIFSVEGVADAKDDLTFRTRRRSYRIIVGQLFRTATPERFVIAIVVR